MAGAEGGSRTARRGRRPGATETRGAVLEAARAQFARDGFTATTIRGVALQAGVDASLVIQFHGSKQGLFAAAMHVPASVLQRLDAAFDGPPEDLGERVVSAFLDVWEGAADDAEPLMAMLRSAVANDLAREQLGDFVQARLLAGARRRTARRHPDADGTAAGAAAALRAAAASAMLVGLVLGRRVIGVPTLADADRAELVRLVAPAIQAVLSGDRR